jgi:hypothetical protein
MRMLLPLVLLASALFQTNSGVIEVVVRDAATRAPLRGARLRFSGSTPVIYVNTDQNGRAVFKDLAPGGWAVSVDQPGYIPPSTVTGRVIGPNAQKHEVEMLLTRGSVVSGRVLDPNGNPVVQAVVNLVTTTYVLGKKTVEAALPVKQAQTDDRGEYRLIGIKPGNYYVRVTLPYSQSPWNNVWNDFPQVVYHPGVLESRNATLITVRPAQDVATIDVRLPNVRTFKVSGIVTNQVPGGRVFDRGVTDRTVRSYYLGPTDPESLENPWQTPLASIREALRSEETGFEIKGVAPGSYYLYTRWDQGPGPTPSWFTIRTPLEVEDRDVEGLRIDLKPSGSIHGRIRVEGNAPLPSSVMRLDLQQKERMWGYLGESSSSTVDPTTGEFTIPSVPEGRFNILVRWLPADAFVSDIRQAGRSVFDDGVAADSSGQPLEITINLKGGIIQGVVQQASSSPDVPAGVTLVPARARRTNPQLYKRVETNANGQFTLRGVAPGEYSIFAWSALPPGQAEENSQFLAPFESRGTTVSVTAGGTTNVQLLAIPLP